MIRVDVPEPHQAEFDYLLTEAATSIGPQPDHVSHGPPPDLARAGDRRRASLTKEVEQ